MKALLSWPILVQRGLVDLRDLRIRRDGRIIFVAKQWRRGLYSLSRIALIAGAFAAIVSFALVFPQGGLTTAQSSMPALRSGPVFDSNDQVGGPLIQTPLGLPNDSLSYSKQSSQNCSELEVGAVLAVSDAEKVRSGSKLKFGGLLVSAVPSDCRAKQIFLIRDDGKKLVIEKLIPQTQNGLRD